VIVIMDAYSSGFVAFVSDLEKEGLRLQRVP
jgi:hypothetical protein